MQTRKALIVGIDYYQKGQCLNGCVHDARAVKNMLARNPADDTINFGIEAMLALDEATAISRSALDSKIETLFNDETGIETALFYFAGHGCIDTTGGYLCTSDTENGKDISLNEVIIRANKCGARNKIIILDSCHSGAAGQRASQDKNSEIGEGVTILTASTDGQYAAEGEEGGLFTSLFIDALGGAAANLMGEITPGSVYAHIDQSLGPWTQRPVFKTNVNNFVSLRRVKPPLALADLHRITEIFPNGTTEIRLDPTYEPDDSVKRHPEDKAIPEHTEIFSVLQKYHHVNLAVPIGAEFPFFAAMERKSMGLTALGRHYRSLVLNNLI